MDMASSQIPGYVGECPRRLPQLAYDDDDDNVAIQIFTFCFFEVYSNRFSCAHKYLFIVSQNLSLYVMTEC